MDDKDVNEDNTPLENTEDIIENTDSEVKIVSEDTALSSGSHSEDDEVLESS
jgi:hypothetical protein